MSKKIGFIGVGNMGGTLAKVAKEHIACENILVSSRTLEKAQAFAGENGFIPMDNKALAEQAQIIFLGVKPQKMAGLFLEIAPVLAARKDRFVLVSMAAGLTCERIAQMADGSYPVLRIMPNTPALYGEGCIPYCSNALVTQEDCKELETILKNAGWIFPLAEDLMDAAGAVSGCGPAFVYIFIEALADAGLACGLPRATALRLAAQTLTGAAQTVLQSGEHPAILKDAVCSPGGSTIAGVHALEEYGFRCAAEKAVYAACKRSKELG